MKSEKSLRLGDYSYSFQGQEHDDEVKGKGNSINYKYRMHDPRIGRFFAVDPLALQYSYNSPYAFSENDVIGAIELEGQEKLPTWYLQISAPPAFTQPLKVMTSQKLTKYDRFMLQSNISVYKKNIYPVYNYITRNSYKPTYYAQTGSSMFQTFVGNANNIGTLGIVDINPVLDSWYGTDFTGHSKKSILNSGIETIHLLNFPNWSVEDHGAFWGPTLIDVELAILSESATKYFIPKGASLATKAGIRRQLAEDFYKKVGGNADEMSGIDFEQPVQTKTYEKGTPLERWTYIDESTGKPKPGSYYTLPGTDPSKLGIPLEGRVRTTVTLAEDTKFLQSAAGDIEDWTNPGNILNGGGIQLYRPDVKIEETVIHQQ